jgi:hypothetical protein
MPEEELDLFDFATCSVAQLCTGSAQIVWCEVIQLRPFGTPPNHVPDDVLGNAFSPGCSVTAHGPEDAASADLGHQHPTIDRFLDPDGHGHGPDMPALANQVDNGPMPLPDLQVFHYQG